MQVETLNLHVVLVLRIFFDFSIFLDAKRDVESAFLFSLFMLRPVLGVLCFRSRHTKTGLDTPPKKGVETHFVGVETVFGC